MVAYVRRNLPSFCGVTFLAAAFTFLTSFLTTFFTAMLVPPVWGVGFE